MTRGTKAAARGLADSNTARPHLELWGGAECTVNRSGDRFIDQTKLTGHAVRLDDLDRFAALGITAIRYPVLWERTAPKGLDTADWRWPDERLGRLRDLGIRPIVGLVHHGSGPAGTSLIDPAFPEHLAEFASAVARRYPWVDAYTPVNEPLTTARFSGLYGLWYPHGRDDSTFIRALLTQCRAVVLAMRAIRAVQPDGKLIQTDDLGKTWSTSNLAYQARRENDRRWLSFDLLSGRVDANHPMWAYLVGAGAAEADLTWFLENPSSPDVLGIDHYLSSERYLDEHLERYPSDSHGGNDQEIYADILAARVREKGPAGPEAILREVWDRYHLPIAITEVHNGCTREEQMRWFIEVWNAAERLRNDGIDIRAITAWSLLGASGWNTLVTSDGGVYEPGVFDVRGPRPRPTAMTGLLRDLVHGRQPQHPLLEVSGWWRRPVRHMYGVAIDDTGNVRMDIPQDPMNVHAGGPSTQPLAITGASGTLGRAFAQLCELRGIPYLPLTHSDLDITDEPAIKRLMEETHPWALVNAAGYVRVDDAEREVGYCRSQNAIGPGLLAGACTRHGVQFLTFSSDLVFDGRQSQPYVESDPVAPLNEYGRSKAEGEARVLDAMPNAMIVRSSAFFGPRDNANFVSAVLRALQRGDRFAAPGDDVVSPTYVPDLVSTSLDLLIDCESGIWHLANEGAITWAALARRVAVEAGMDPGLIVERSASDTRLPARRARTAYWGARMVNCSLPSTMRYAATVRIAGINNRVCDPQRRLNHGRPGTGACFRGRGSRHRRRCSARRCGE